MFKKTTKSKLRHDFQAFSKIHYEDLVQKAVTEAWDDALDNFDKGRIDKKPNNLTVIQKVTKAIFMTQPQAVKDRARKYCLTWNKVIDKGREPGNEEDEATNSEDAEEVVQRCSIGWTILGMSCHLSLLYLQGTLLMINQCSASYQAHPESGVEWASAEDRVCWYCDFGNTKSWSGGCN